MVLVLLRKFKNLERDYCDNMKIDVKTMFSRFGGLIEWIISISIILLLGLFESFSELLVHFVFE